MIATYDTSSVDTISFIVLAHGLIVAGVIFRVVFCAVKMMTAEDTAQYKRRMINAVVFGIIAQAAFTIKNIILTYFA